MKLDAYHCTIAAGADEVAAELSRLFVFAEMQPIRGRTNGYERIVGWHHGPQEVVRMYHGGNGSGVHVQVQGPESPEVANRIRKVFLDHGVSRADVCQDWDYPGAWEEIRSEALRLAQVHRLKVKEILGHGDGDTLYLGSRKSVVSMRIYQKGKEMQGPTGNPDWVRVEIEVRPGTSVAKRLMATMAPGEIFGASDWSRELSTWLGNISPDRVRLGTIYRSPEIERTRRWLVSQALESLEHWAEEVGGWSALGRAMHEKKAELEAMKEMAWS